MKIFGKRRNPWFLACFAVGLLLIGNGLFMANWRDSQANYYNLALDAFKQGDIKAAQVYAQKSERAYQQGLHYSWLERFGYPGPDREIAALAYFLEAKTYLAAQPPQAQKAVDSLKKSLKLNPGDQVMDCYPGSDTLASEACQTAGRLRDEALPVKKDLEKLYKSNQSLQDGEGKKGAKGNKPGDKGQPQRQPGNNPGTQAGKGNPLDP